MSSGISVGILYTTAMHSAYIPGNCHMLNAGFSCQCMQPHAANISPLCGKWLVFAFAFQHATWQTKISTATCFLQMSAGPQCTELVHKCGCKTPICCHVPFHVLFHQTIHHVNVGSVMLACWQGGCLVCSRCDCISLVCMYAVQLGVYVWTTVVGVFISE